MVDSLVVFLWKYNIYPAYTLDTTYTIYPGVDTTLAYMDTTFKWHIETIKDSLFYRDGDSLVYFMPWKFDKDDFDTVVQINLGIFDYPWESTFSYLFDRYGLKGTVADTSEYYIYGFAGNKEYNYGGWMDAYFIPELGGMTYMNATHAPTDMGWEKENLVYQLKEYVPGIIESK